MEFRIADTFTDSLAKLTGDEQKSTKTTAFDLQMDPSGRGMRFHKLDRARDKNFCSVRVSGDIRIILHKTEANLLLCYVDHHDKAYAWAERRKIERHPATGAAQLVEIREEVREVIIPKYVEVEQPAPPTPPLFAGVSDEELLGYGVPEEWLEDVRQATEDTLFEVAEHLPAEASEALLQLATGTTPVAAAPIGAEEDPFTHPDAHRRFRVMTNIEELKQALDAPWEKWTVFLHPTQQELVGRDYGGPARVAGSAGTGKTIVALHRAVHLARTYPDARVLLTTFSITLARNLRRKLSRLVGDETGLAERINVRAINEVGLELYEAAHGRPNVPTTTMLRTLIRAASAAVEGHKFSLRFLETEWTDVVDAWQLDTWEAYRDVARLGRKTRLGEKQRQMAWSVFDLLRADLDDRGFVTLPAVFAAATQALQEGAPPPADFVVVDEAQDITVYQLRFLAALAGDRDNGLFFAGDLGQRIFQTPFSWRSLGVDVRGRSHTLRINYRTSHQIRRQADRLLEPEITDVDGNEESRRGTVSVFNGPEPAVAVAESAEEEAAVIGEWLADRAAEGLRPHEMAVFVRSEAELPRARTAVRAAGLQAAELDHAADAPAGSVAIGTMHTAKGLEFRAAVVAACDDEILPFQSRIEAVADEADLEDVYNTERHLLYVACTRARDQLLITGVDPVSEFLDDLRLV